MYQLYYRKFPRPRTHNYLTRLSKELQAALHQVLTSANKGKYVSGLCYKKLHRPKNIFVKAHGRSCGHFQKVRINSKSLTVLTKKE